MQPQSLAHHQLDSLPRQRDRLWLLPCAGHLWPAAQRAPYKRRQVKSGYVSPLLGTRRQHIQSTVAGEGKGQKGGGGGVLASMSSVENNRLQWDVFGKQRLGSHAISPSCFLFPGPLPPYFLKFPIICPSAIRCRNLIWTQASWSWRFLSKHNGFSLL